MSREGLRVILIHGSCHGAWCWYKVVAELRSQGYISVTAIDLAACGADSRRLPEDVWTFEEYNRPLMEFMSTVPDGEKVILVGHSFGGINLAFAMDAFPQKIAAAIFLTAILPDTLNQPSYVIDQDLTMASMMVRPTLSFSEDLSNKSPFTEEGFGSVDKIYIICNEDAPINEDYARKMIQNNDTVKEIIEIKGADHMPMLSKPRELCQNLASIIHKYSSVYTLSK